MACCRLFQLSAHTAEVGNINRRKKIDTIILLSHWITTRRMESRKHVYQLSLLMFSLQRPDRHRAENTSMQRLRFHIRSLLWVTFHPALSLMQLLCQTLPSRWMAVSLKGRDSTLLRRLSVEGLLSSSLSQDSIDTRMMSSKFLRGPQEMSHADYNSLWQVN